ncbi:MAG: hypothetical protein ACP5IV_07510 [Caldisericia bacterium]
MVKKTNPRNKQKELKIMNYQNFEDEPLDIISNRNINKEDKRNYILSDFIKSFANVFNDNDNPKDILESLKPYMKYEITNLLTICSIRSIFLYEENFDSFSEKILNEYKYLKKSNGYKDGNDYLYKAFIKNNSTIDFEDEYENLIEDAINIAIKNPSIVVEKQMKAYEETAKDEKNEKERQIKRRLEIADEEKEIKKMKKMLKKRKKSDIK